VLVTAALFVGSAQLITLSEILQHFLNWTKPNLQKQASPGGINGTYCCRASYGLSITTTADDDDKSNNQRR